MTKTRKQIIDIIEPYMDKTLSDGCYIINSYSWEEEIDKILKADEWWPFERAFDVSLYQTNHYVSILNKKKKIYLNYYKIYENNITRNI